MSDDSETTVWQKVRRKPRPEYEGEDRRGPPAPNYIKDLAPYIIGAAGIFSSFQLMEYKVERLQQDIKELEREVKATDAAQWQRISDLMGTPVVPR